MRTEDLGGYHMTQHMVLRSTGALQDQPEHDVIWKPIQVSDAGVQRQSPHLGCSRLLGAKNIHAASSGIS